MCYFIHPSNPDALHLYYSERQLSIKIPHTYYTMVKGRNNKNIKVISQKYNISIIASNIYHEEKVEFILTHNNWLKITDPKNKIQECRGEITSLYYKSIRCEIK